MKFKWEDLEDKTMEEPIRIRTRRAKVKGGWIVQNLFAMNDQICQSMVFVPDTQHTWEIER